jgi:mevalonate kinase
VTAALRPAAEAGLTDDGTAGRRELCVRAPGKAFIIGEYAVLYGGPAVVAAVARYARAQLRRGPRPALSPFLEEITRRFAPPPGSYPVVDTSDLAAADGTKLGLGSSAAATVAAAAVMRARVGCDLAEPGERARLLELCTAAHRAAQGGRGSGADVAAAVHGGVLRVTRFPARLEVAPAALPRGHRLLFFPLGAPASTVSLVRAVEEMDTERRSRFIADLGDAAARFAERPIEAMRRFHRGLMVLGEAAGAPIVPPAVHDLVAAAERLGGAAKTSGAGGGDLAVALVPDDAAEALLAATPLRALFLDVDHVGVACDP